MKKRLVFLALCLALLLCLFPAFSSADASGSCGTNLKWTFTASTGTLTITGSGAMTNFTITGQPWASVSSSIKTVSLPSGLTAIGDYAFYGCYYLTAINVPSGLKTIGKMAFSFSGITSFPIPSKVTGIGAGAFADCSKLTSFEVNAQNTSFVAVDGVLYSYDKKTIVACPYGREGSYSILSSVTTIGSYAFAYCGKLTAISIPSAVTSIGENAFYNCSKLTALTIPSGLKTIEAGVFFGCQKLTSFTIPSGVTSIGHDAFRSCSGLTSLTIPANVTSIGYGAFEDCSNLLSINIPSGVTAINSYTFARCKKLTSITIPAGVTSLDMYAFQNCTGLTDLIIADGATKLECTSSTYPPFSGCTALQNLTMPCSLNVNSSLFAGCTSISSVHLTKGTGTMSLNYSGYTNTPWYLSTADSLSVTLDAGITDLGASAFRDCQNLTSVVIPDTVTNLGYSTFQGCTGLTHLTMPCSAAIGYNTFTDCANITDLHLTQGTGTWTESYYTYTPWYMSRASLTTLTLDDGISSIGSKAFSECTALTSLTMPCSVSVKNDSFAYGAGLTSIHLTKGTGTWSATGGYAFPMYKNSATLTSVTLDEGIKSIGNNAFYCCAHLTSVAIPDSVTSIGGSSFWGCSGLTEITLGKNVTSISDTSFTKCFSLTAFHVDEDNPSYSDGEGALCTKDMTRLICFPAGKAAAGCIVPDGVTAIAPYAFYQYADLASLTLPASLETVGNYAFNGCSALANVTYQGTPEERLTLDTGTNNDPLLQAAWRYAEDSLPAIAVQPQSLTTDEDVAARFEIQAFGNDVAYLWQYRVPGEESWHDVATNGDGDALTWAGSAAYGGYAFRCRVYNDAGSVYSSVVTLTVNARPAVTTHPVSITVDEDATATFTVAAVGSDLQYRWQYQQPGESVWHDVNSNGSAASYSFAATAAHNGSAYRCKVSNTAGSAYSNAATLTVRPKPVITGQPTDVTAYEGKKATFRVVATGATSYRWQYQKPGATAWSNVSSSGATDAYTLTVAVRHNGYAYRCVVSNAVGDIYSEIATLTVIGKPTITLQPVDVTVTEGEVAVFQVEAADAVSYKWQYLKPGETDWTDVSKNGAAATYSFTAALRHNRYMYRVEVTNPAGSVFSDVVMLLVNPKPSPSPTPRPGPSSTPESTDTAQPTASCGANLKWTIDTEGGSYSGGIYTGGESKLTISGSGAMYDFTSPNNQPWSASEKTIDEIKIKYGAKTIGRYAFAKVLVHYLVEIPDSVTSVGDYAFYQCWRLPLISIGTRTTYVGVSAFEGTALESLNMPDNVTSIGARAFARCSKLKKAFLPSGLIDIPDSLFLYCTALPSIQLPAYVQTMGAYAFYGCEKLESINFTSEMRSIGHDAFGSCPSLTDVNFTGTKHQRDAMYIGEGNEALLNATWHYLPVYTLELVTLPDKLVYNLGDELDVSGGVIRVRYSNGVREDEPITADMVTGFTCTQLGQQTLTVTFQDMTVTFDVTVAKLSKPTITTQPKSVTVAAGKKATFKVVADGAESYKWQYQKPGSSTWTNVSKNGTSASYSLTTAAKHNGYKYRCAVKNAAGTVYAKAVTLTVQVKPTIKTQPKAATVYVGKKASFTVVAIDAESYKWQYQKPGESTWTNVSKNGTAATYSLTTAAKHDGYSYRCAVKNAAGTVYSNAVKLTVSVKPVITTQPKAVSVAAGAKATFKVVAVGATSYKWQYQKPGSSTWTNVSKSGTSASYSLTTAAKHNGYTYRCAVTNDKGTVYTKSVTLTVK